MIFLPIENVTTRGLQFIVGTICFIVIPSVYLMSSSDVKSVIIDKKICLAFLTRFPSSINQIVQVNDINEEIHKQHR